MSEVVRCPALMISAPASGQGKTSVTAALARFHVRRGKKVRVFKTGPDFLDPTILARASGEAVRQLDLFMGGDRHCREMLCDAAANADLILVEGAMGLFDGAPSSADLAQAFGLPVWAVIDASAMAQTFGALAHGLATFQPGLRVSGVVANRVASASHGRMVGQSLPRQLPLVAAIELDETLGLPQRHLGLVQAQELPELDQHLEHLADAWERGSASHELPASVVFAAPPAGTRGSSASRPLQGVRIAIADDAAFSFIYAENLETLRRLGADLVMFSPLAEAELPACDALWLPGGYPELHAARLEANRSMAVAIRAHHAQGKPLLAECGGLLYLLDGLTLQATSLAGEQRRYDFCGVLAGEGWMKGQLTAIGLQAVALPEGEMRGHSFHHSALETPMAIIGRGRCPNGGRTAEAVYRSDATTASYIHLYFPSNPDAIARLFCPTSASLPGASP